MLLSVFVATLLVYFTIGRLLSLWLKPQIIKLSLRTAYGPKTAVDNVFQWELGMQYVWPLALPVLIYGATTETRKERIKEEIEAYLEYSIAREVDRLPWV